MSDELIEVIEKWDMDGRLIERRINGVKIELTDIEKTTSQIIVHLPKDKYSWVSQKRFMTQEEINNCFKGKV